MKSVWIMSIAVWFFISENSYFGWNLTPHSDAELIADGMVLLMTIFAIMSKEGL